MASKFTTIDASSADSGVDYAEYFAAYFNAISVATRGATSYYDSKFYAGLGPTAYYTGSQAGIEYKDDTSKALVLMEGAAMQYDGVDGVNHGSYSGSVDSVTFGYRDASTTFAQIDGVARSTIIGVVEDLVISGLNIAEAIGAGSEVGKGNDFLDLMTYLRDGNSDTIAEGNTLTNGELAIQKLYEIFASKAQHFIGSAGDDTYVGTKFADKIDGGAGFDTLSGGKGKDVFIFDLGDSAATVEDADIILDFQVKKDRIDLSAIDTNLIKDGDQAFKFFGNGDLGAKPGVAWEKVGTQTHVSIDTNGDATADMLIILEGNFKLTADHFIL